MSYEEMKELRVFYRYLINQMCTNRGIKRFFDNPTPDTYEDIFSDNEVGEFLESLDVCLMRGETKAVFYEETKPYVIKVPLEGNSGTYSNYCELEYEHYSAACEAGIDDCFAWTDYLMEYGTTSIYIMEKVDANEDEMNDRSYTSAWRSLRESYKEVNEEDFNDDFWNMDDEDKIDCLLNEYWGEEKTCKFFEFCEENEINDKHLGNWGLRGDYPVIIDYSGY